jgi:hypothetical protein
MCKRFAGEAASRALAQGGKSDMSTDKLRVNRNLVMALVVTLASVAGGALLMWNPSAASTDSATLSVVQDSYTDINAPTTNFDGGLLNVANSFGAPGEPDVTTKYVFLQFDLSGVGFEIKSATLSLATLHCGGQAAVDEVNVAIYGVDNAPTNAWSETTLTWDTQPALSTSTSLITLDAGATTADSARWVTWTDDSGVALASWLEAQRLANDQSATLVLAIENSSGPGIADVFFEDREGSGAAYGCADSLGGPTLEVSDRVGDYQIFLPLIER